MIQYADGATSITRSYTVSHSETDIKVMKKMFNRIMFFEKFNSRNNYGQDEQNNHTDQRIHYNDNYNDNNK